MADVEHAPPRGRVRAEAAGLLDNVRGRLRGRDVALVAAGLTFYAGVSVVPLIVLAVGLTTWTTSVETVQRLSAAFAELLPATLGAPRVLDLLVDAGVGLSPAGAVLTLFPLTFYGEGLRRALLRFTADRESFTGWRGRLATLPLIVLAPALLYPLLLVARELADLTADGGLEAGLAAVVVSFYAVLLALLLPLAWGFRVVAAGRLGWRAVLLGSSFTAACLSGFLLGFVLFLALPIDLGAPFGGLTAVGAAVAVALWIFLLHLVMLAGWLLTQAVEDRLGAVGS